MTINRSTYRKLKGDKRTRSNPEEAVADFDELDDPIEVRDGGFTVNDRFCEKKGANGDYIPTLRSNARTIVVGRFVGFMLTEEEGTRHLTDEVIELSVTVERFYRIPLDDHNDEVTESLTTLQPGAYDPIDVLSVYTLHTLIEICFREGKQYTNFERFPQLDA